MNEYFAHAAMSGRKPTQPSHVAREKVDMRQHGYIELRSPTAPKPAKTYQMDLIPLRSSVRECLGEDNMQLNMVKAV